MKGVPNFGDSATSFILLKQCHLDSLVLCLIMYPYISSIKGKIIQLTVHNKASHQEIVRYTNYHVYTINCILKHPVCQNVGQVSLKCAVLVLELCNACQ